MGLLLGFIIMAVIIVIINHGYDRLMMDMEHELEDLREDRDDAMRYKMYLHHYVNLLERAYLKGNCDGITPTYSCAAAYEMSDDWVRRGDLEWMRIQARDRAAPSLTAYDDWLAEEKADPAARSREQAGLDQLAELF